MLGAQVFGATQVFPATRPPPQDAPRLLTVNDIKRQTQNIRADVCAPLDLIAQTLLQDTHAPRDPPSFGRKLAVVAENDGRLLVCSVGGARDNILYISDIRHARRGGAPFKRGNQAGRRKLRVPEDAGSDDALADAEVRTDTADDDGRPWELRATAVPAHTFSSAILDVQASQTGDAGLHLSAANTKYPRPWLAIRTRAHTLVCAVVRSRGADIARSGFPYYSLRTVTELSATPSPSAHGAQPRPWADLAFSSATCANATLVNDDGQLATWALEGALAGILTARGRALAGAYDPDRETGWRLSQGQHGDAPQRIFAYCASRIFACDLRAREDARQLLYSAKLHPWLVARERVTHVTPSRHGDHDGAGLLFASTTAQVLCFDARMPRRPLCAWQHGRGPDDSLALSAVAGGVGVHGIGDAPAQVLLSSRHSRLLTTYTAARTAGSSAPPQPCQVLGGLGPGALPGSAPICVDWAAFEDRHLEQSACAHALFEMSSTGAVVLSGLGSHQHGESERASSVQPAPRCFDIAPAGPGVTLVRKLEEHFAQSGAGHERECQLLDFAPVWKAALAGDLVRLAPDANDSSRDALRARHLQLPFEAAASHTVTHGFPPHVRSPADDKAAVKPAASLHIREALEATLGDDLFTLKQFAGSGSARNRLERDLEQASKVALPRNIGVESTREVHRVSGVLAVDEEAVTLKGVDEAALALVNAPEVADFPVLGPLYRAGTWGLPRSNRGLDGSKFAERAHEHGIREIRLGAAARLVLDDWTLGAAPSASLYTARAGRPGARGEGSRAGSVGSQGSARRSTSMAGARESASLTPGPRLAQRQPPSVATSSQIAPSFPSRLRTTDSPAVLPAQAALRAPLLSAPRPAMPRLPDASSSQFSMTPKGTQQPPRKKKRMGGF